MLANIEQTNHIALVKEIAARRTFAIISHPDAGKTTLTEKLLLYGNAIDLAGSVRARRNQRGATSDWMAMERERGISITSTVLQFPYSGRVLNLLDTPGHEDFSEDTYRTLTAVDSAVMVLDAAKGVEPQTRKLFEVCRKRGIPVFTFINKMDRPARDPLELLDEIQEVLDMEPVPMNWPLGDGPDFRGVYDRERQGVYIYERTDRNERIAPETFVTLQALRGRNLLSDEKLTRLQEFYRPAGWPGHGARPGSCHGRRADPGLLWQRLDQFWRAPVLGCLRPICPDPSGLPVRKWVGLPRTAELFWLHL